MIRPISLVAHNQVKKHNVYIVRETTFNRLPAILCRCSDEDCHWSIVWTNREVDWSEYTLPPLREHSLTADQ